MFSETSFVSVPTAIHRTIAWMVAPVGRLEGYTADSYDDFL